MFCVLKNPLGEQEQWYITQDLEKAYFTPKPKEDIGGNSVDEEDEDHKQGT